MAKGKVLVIVTDDDTNEIFKNIEQVKGYDGVAVVDLDTTIYYVDDTSSPAENKRHESSVKAAVNMVKETVKELNTETVVWSLVDDGDFVEQVMTLRSKMDLIKEVILTPM